MDTLQICKHSYIVGLGGNGTKASDAALGKINRYNGSKLKGFLWFSCTFVVAINGH